MAKMLPNVMGADAPGSERRIFELLRGSPRTADWTVLHSLGLSSAYSGAYGEVDFVAIVPGRGIICIEVKGGRVQCQAGVWTTTDRNDKTHALSRSPFQQAREGMFKVLEAVRKRFGPHSAEARCPLGWVVIFTDTSAPPPSPDFTSEELIDSRDLGGDPIAKLKACPSLEQANRRLGPPSKETLSSLCGFLRPDFDRVAMLSTTLWDIETRIGVLTGEQYAVLDHIVENESSLVHGGAGTGKTMLAVELARRAVAEGRSVLLTCFNRELGHWLEARAKEMGDQVRAGHLHRLLRDQILSSDLRGELVEGQFDRGFYELGALAVASGAAQVDLVLVDEAQDFPADALVDVIEAYGTGGDRPPSRVLFADFSRQALYAAPSDSRAVIKAKLAPAYFSLLRNCRNTRRIASETEALTGSFECKAFEAQPVGIPVERFFYPDARGQIRAVDRALQQLRSEGFSAEDIVILGGQRRERSCLANVDSCGGFRIVDREGRTASTQVPYSTIHAFKGLESSAVILIDVDPQPDGAGDALLYVAMTRARSRLIMILSERARSEIQRRERENIARSLAGSA
jgi:hypothetical protein